MFENIAGSNICVYLYNREDTKPILREKSLTAISGIPSKMIPSENALKIVNSLIGINALTITEARQKLEERENELSPALAGIIEQFIGFAERKDKGEDRAVSISSAVHAPVLTDEAHGELSVVGILDGSEDGDAKKVEKVRRFVLDPDTKNTRELKVAGLSRAIQFSVWDSESKIDRENNDIIQNNLNEIFSHLSDDKRTEERRELVQRLTESADEREASGEDRRIVWSILDQSEHWFENSACDGWGGSNRYLFDLIAGTESSIQDMAKESDKAELCEKLKIFVRVLNIYFQTYIYHELRHEGLIEERRLLHDMEITGQLDNLRTEEGYRLTKSGRNIVINKHVDGMTIDEMRFIMDNLPNKGEFTKNVERRMNGDDARFFFERLETEGIDWWTALKLLEEDKVTDVSDKRGDNAGLFAQAVALLGFARYGIDIPDEKLKTPWTKHTNELIDDDFKGLTKKAICAKDPSGKFDYIRRLFGNYKDNPVPSKAELHSYDRGSITNMLYELGLSDFPTIPNWRSRDALDKAVREREGKKATKPENITKMVEEYAQYEIEMARASIIRLMDYLRTHVYDPENCANGFRALKVGESAPSYKTIAETYLNSVEYLADGNFSSAVLRNLGFTTCGFLNTVYSNITEYREMLSGVCGERVGKNDKRFRNIDIHTLNVTANATAVKKGVLPRVRAMALFSEYIRSDSSPEIKSIKGILNKYVAQYNQFMEGGVFEYDETVEKSIFDGLYNDLNKYLLKKFGKRISDVKDGDFLQAIWEAVEIGENLTSDDANAEQSGLGSKDVKQIRVLTDNLKKDKNYIYIDPAFPNSKFGPGVIQYLITIHGSKIVSCTEKMKGALRRYGINEKRGVNEGIRDVMLRSRARSSALWAVNYFRDRFSAGGMKVCEVNSAFSMVQGVMSELGIARKNSIYDHVVDKQFAGFAKNPNIIQGDLGDSQEEGFDVLMSIYDRGITDAAKCTKMLKDAYKKLKFGGHYAVTLPEVWSINEYYRGTLAGMGFEVVDAVNGYNRLAGVNQELDVDAVNENLKNQRFSVYILRKVGNSVANITANPGKNKLIETTGKSTGSTVTPGIINDTGVVLPEIMEAISGECNVQVVLDIKFFMESQIELRRREEALKLVSDAGDDIYYILTMPYANEISEFARGYLENTGFEIYYEDAVKRERIVVVRRKIEPTEIQGTVFGIHRASVQSSDESSSAEDIDIYLGDGVEAKARNGGTAVVLRRPVILGLRALEQFGDRGLVSPDRSTATPEEELSRRAQETEKRRAQEAETAARLLREKADKKASANAEEARKAAEKAKGIQLKADTHTQLSDEADTLRLLVMDIVAGKDTALSEVLRREADDMASEDNNANAEELRTQIEALKVLLARIQAEIERKEDEKRQAELAKFREENWAEFEARRQLIERYRNCAGLIYARREKECPREIGELIKKTRGQTVVKFIQLIKITLQGNN